MVFIWPDSCNRGGFHSQFRGRSGAALQGGFAVPRLVRRIGGIR